MEIIYNPKTFSKQLNAFRGGERMTLEEFSRRSGFPVNTLRNWLDGKVKPSTNSLEKLYKSCPKIAEYRVPSEEPDYEAAA